MTEAIKLIVTDMDGTLLNSDHQLPVDFPEVFQSLKDKGILFCAASGRQYPNLKETLDQYIDDVYFIAENGGVVAHGQEEIFTTPVEKNLLRELVGVAQNIPDTYIVLCGKDVAYLDSDDERLLHQVKQYYSSFKVVSSFEEVLDQEFLKLTICDFAISEQNSYPHFQPYEKDLSVKVSSHIWLDVSMPLANKGYALSQLQKKLGIREEETMVFGDYLNDVEMMQQAYYSYAMENAHPLLKEKARFATKSNNQEGVTHIIKSKILV